MFELATDFISNGLDYFENWSSRKWYGFVFCICICIYVIHILAAGTVKWGDSFYYFAYTRSIVHDQDLNLINESTYPGHVFPYLKGKNPQTGFYAGVYISPGPSLLWLLPYVPAEGVRVGLNALGIPLNSDGFSRFSMGIVGFFCVALGVGGLWLLEKSLIKTKISQARWIVFTLFVGTQVFYYLAVDPMNSHSLTFFFSSLSFWLLIRWWQTPSHGLWEAAALGAAAGALGLCRNQDFLLFVPILIVMMLHPSKTLSTKLLSILQTSTIGVLFVFIQLVFNWYINGHPLGLYLTNNGFAWLRPDLLRVSLSPQNGQFFYAPLVLGLCIGAGWLVAKESGLKRMLAAAGLLYFLLEWYVIASWGPETLGGPYGSRMFTATLPWIVIGLAPIMSLIWKSNARKTIWLGILAVLFSWNCLQIISILLRNT